jgi:alpha-L-fucosidase 2
MRARRFALGCLLLLLGPIDRLWAADVSARVDWQRFLARHDLLWSGPPASWEEGAPLGNGLVGAMVHLEPKEGGLVWELGRTDVVEDAPHPVPILARGRLPIGRMVLSPPGPVTGRAARLDLWNAEVRGDLRTEKGALRFRSYVHAELPLLVIELEDGKHASVSFRPELPINPRRFVRKIPLGHEDVPPAPYEELRGETRVSVAPHAHRGETAVAWRELRTGARRLFLIAVARSSPQRRARDEALDIVDAAARTGPQRLTRSHRAYWHGYYPASFVSIPDARLESFYWIQIYKLAAATRAQHPLIDTLGPWYRSTPWPGVWWNLNVQLSYWPVYAANRLDLGESLLRTLAANRDNLRANAPERLRGQALAVGRTSGPDARSPVEDLTGLPEPGQKRPHEIGNLLWTAHNVWLHWRHSMDARVMREDLVPLLQGALLYVSSLLTRGADGKLHLPLAVSPEYPKAAADTNYDLALLRWGCAAMIELAERWNVQDPHGGRWREILRDLAPYPSGPDGYLIGHKVPLAESHRHFSHLMMIYPPPPRDRHDPGRTGNHRSVRPSLDRARGRLAGLFVRHRLRDLVLARQR